MEEGDGEYDLVERKEGDEFTSKWKGGAYEGLEELLEVAVGRAVEDLESKVDGDPIDCLI